MLESNVLVRCRQVDLPLVEAAIPVAVASVKDKTKIDTTIKLDKESFLPADW